VPDVIYDTDDFASLWLVADDDALTERVFIRVKTPRETLVNDRDLRCAVAVGFR
jgi:hypothetical protein